MSENLTVQNEENVTIATFNITEANTTITLKNLTGMTSIDWGDGTVNGELTHEYVEVGEYTCRIYDVTEIGFKAFYGYSSLINIEISSLVTRIGMDAFSRCEGMTSVIISNSVTSIGSGAFQYCSSLTTVEIPNSVTSIENAAFDECSGLISVVISDSITSINNWTFRNCSSLTSVKIPNSVTKIGLSAFENCESITSVIIPDNVISIAQSVFKNCGKLTNVTIPGSLTYIDSNVFSGCNSLTSIYYTGDIEDWCNISFNGMGANPLQYVKELYINGEQITELVIPDTIAKISNYAFINCDSLTSVTIPDSVTSIGSYAFYNCDSLTSVVIGDSVTSIGYQAFEYCSDLQIITFKSLTPLSTLDMKNSQLSSNAKCVFYVPTEAFEEYQTAWSGTIDKNRIQPDCVEKLVTVGGLREYNKSMKETYINPLKERIEEVENSFDSAKIVKEGMTTNEEEWTEEDKAAARELIGAVAKDDISEPTRVMISTTYAELKTLRDNAELIPGQFYRITDYMCTTSQENTKAMNHQFDIIVQALSESQLSESAKADYHDSDTYFKSNSATPIIPYYFIIIDSNGTLENDGDYFANKDRFVERGHLENDEGETVPVLYKTGNDYSDDEADYDDPYFYMGREEYEGVTYDKWRHIEYNADGWDSEAQIYLYTNIIIADDGYTFLTDGKGGEKIANLNAWQLKYCLDNDTDRFAWANDRAVLRVTNEDSYMYIRYHDGDNENGYAWAYVIESDNKDFPEAVNWNDIDESDLIYTQTMDLKHGDPLDMDGEPVTVIDYRKELGRGVIYWMKDEWNNECPYDFKNIQFKRYYINEVDDALVDSGLVGHYLGLLGGKGYTIEETDYIWCYTFSWLNENDTVEDLSIVGQYLKNDEEQCPGVYDNIIKYVSNYEMMGTSFDLFKIALNDIVFLNEYAYDAGFFLGCYDNTFGNNCFHNTFSNSCFKNTFGNSCTDNTFGNSCTDNTFGILCTFNTFGNDCNYNTFDSYCMSNVFKGSNNNTFGRGCYENTFKYSSYNIFGKNCLINSFEGSTYNIFSNACTYNTFGNDCHYNTFGNSCSHNTFVNDCYYNTFGNDCDYNTFGEGCYYNRFGNGCNNILVQKDYVQYINIAEGCQYIQFVNNEEPSFTNQIQNITIGQGVRGTAGAILQLQVNRNAAPVIYRAKNTTEIILD